MVPAEPGSFFTFKPWKPEGSDSISFLGYWATCPALHLFEEELLPMILAWATCPD